MIPDIAEAVTARGAWTPTPCRAGRLLDLAPAFPAVTWGRDELRAGEMWNSNSLIAWLLVRSGHRPARSGRRRRPCSRMVGRADRRGQGYAGTMAYSSMRNHDPSAAAISFRQVMTPGSEASQVKRSRGPVSRAVAVLVVAMPCPLILAAPVALVSGLSAAARRGIVVKNGGVLERLARCTTVLLDKTGTLTADRRRRQTMNKRTRAAALGSRPTALARRAGDLSRFLPAPVPDLGRPARRGVEEAAR